MKKFYLELEEGEVNIILNALAGLPFKEVFQIMPKIQGQCNSQMQPAAEALPKTADTAPAAE